MKGHLDVVRELLCADGIQVNRSLTDGQSPVLAAAEEGHSEVIKLLVAAGADVNARVVDPSPHRSELFFCILDDNCLDFCSILKYWTVE